APTPIWWKVSAEACEKTVSVPVVFANGSDPVETGLVASLNRPGGNLTADKQIELLTNFASQAVIAIENTRLLNELRESLQQQTATSEVLGVISRSPGELEPVFQVMLKNALRICEAKFGMLQRYSDGTFVTQAMVGAPPALVDVLMGKLFTPAPGIPLDRMLRTKKVVHTLDAAAEENKPLSARLAGARSHIVVPMLKDDELIGSISIYRQEVRPFTNKQIDLLTNCAAQAVIAIETTRLRNDCANRCSSSPLPPTCSKSLAARPSILLRCSKHWSRPRRDCAKPIRASSPAEKGLAIGLRPTSDPEFVEYVRELLIEPGRNTLVGRTALEGRT